MSVTLAKLLVLVGSDTAQAEKGLGDVNKALQRSESVGKTALGVFSGVIMSKAIAGIGDLASEGLNAYASFERLGMSMNALAARESMIAGESASMAEAMDKTEGTAQGLLNTIQQMAILSPFRQESISSIMQTAMGYGMASSMALDMTDALVDLASATGRAEKDMQLLGLGLGQVWAKGKLTGEEMRQLTNAGISVADVARAMKIPISDVADAIKAGEISARELIPALIELIETDFGGEAARQATSWAGLLSTFEDLREVNLRELFSGTLEELQPLADELANTLGSPEFRAEVRATGEQIGQAVGQIVTSGRELLGMWEQIPDAAKGAAAAFAGVFIAGPQVVGTMSSVVSGGIKLVQVFQQLNAGVGWFAVAQQGAIGLTGALTPVAAMVASITAAYVMWKKTSDQVEQGNQMIANTWDDLIAEMVMQGATPAQIMAAISAKSADAQAALESQGFAGEFLARVMGAEVAPSLDQVSTALKASGAGYDEYAAAIVDYLVAQGKVPDFERDSWVEMLTVGESAQEVAGELGVMTRATYESTVAIAKQSGAVEMTQKEYKAYTDAMQKAAAATNMQKAAAAGAAPVMMQTNDLMALINDRMSILPENITDGADSFSFLNDAMGITMTAQEQLDEDVRLLTDAWAYGVIGNYEYSESMLDVTQGTFTMTQAQREAYESAIALQGANALAAENAGEAAKSYWSLAESLKGASQAEIAKTLIDDLTASLEANPEAAADINAAILEVSDAFGITDERSRALAAGVPLLTQALEKGLIPAENMDEALKYLVEDARDGEIDFGKLIDKFGEAPAGIQPALTAASNMDRAFGTDIPQAFIDANQERLDFQQGLQALADWVANNPIEVQITVEQVVLPSTGSGSSGTSTGTGTGTGAPQPRVETPPGTSGGGPPPEASGTSFSGNFERSASGGATYINVNQYNYNQQAAAVSNAEVDRIKRQSSNARMGR
ncbi:MAG: tape measure protein [Chloroflexota bacterium]